MDTKNYSLTGNWLRIADGAGDVTFRPTTVGVEWVIKPTAWVPVDAFRGHCGYNTENTSLRLIAGESVWVRGTTQGLVVVTAQNPVP